MTTATRVTWWKAKRLSRRMEACAQKFIVSGFDDGHYRLKKGRWVCDWASNKSAKCYITLQECLCSKLGNKRGSREISPQCLNSHITFFLSLSLYNTVFLSHSFGVFLFLSICNTVFPSHSFGVFLSVYPSLSLSYSFPFLLLRSFLLSISLSLSCSLPLHVSG